LSVVYINDKSVVQCQHTAPELHCTREISSGTAGANFNQSVKLAQANILCEYILRYHTVACAVSLLALR